ncbi:MAG: hypothetical protein EOO29_50615, partial [Comamonadaceae bacterium]
HPIFQRIAIGAAQREHARELAHEPVRWLREAGFGALRGAYGDALEDGVEAIAQVGVAGCGCAHGRLRCGRPEARHALKKEETGQAAQPLARGRAWGVVAAAAHASTAGMAAVKCLRRPESAHP